MSEEKKEKQGDHRVNGVQDSTVSMELDEVHVGPSEALNPLKVFKHIFNKILIELFLLYRYASLNF